MSGEVVVDSEASLSVERRQSRRLPHQEVEFKVTLKLLTKTRVFLFHEPKLRNLTRRDRLRLSFTKAKSHYTSQAGLQLASELDSVVESGALHFASSSPAGRRPAGELIADLVSDLSQTVSYYLDMSR